MPNSQPPKDELHERLMEKERLSKKRVGAAAPGPAEEAGRWVMCFFFWGGGDGRQIRRKSTRGSMLKAQVVWKKGTGFTAELLSLCDEYFATEKWSFFQ